MNEFVFFLFLVNFCGVRDTFIKIAGGKRMLSFLVTWAKVKKTIARAKFGQQDTNSIAGYRGGYKEEVKSQNKGTV